MGFGHFLKRNTILMALKKQMEMEFGEGQPQTYSYKELNSANSLKEDFKLQVRMQPSCHLDFSL